MLRRRQTILVSAAFQCLAAATALVLLVGCGQKGPLFLPGGPAAANRASLPETLAPSTSVSSPLPAASAPPATGTAAPVRNP